MQEAQIRHRLKQMDIEKDFDELEFQVAGVPEENPRSQLKATTYMRVFAQSAKKESVARVVEAVCFSLIDR